MAAPRVAVVGLGAMGINHARVYHDIGARLVAVCDLDESRGKTAAQRYRCDYVKDFGELLNARGVDALSIVTPTEHHHALAKAAIEAGKHVLVEKPLCDTLPKARELVELARAKGVVLAVGHVERHNPVVAAAKRLIASGEVGEVLSISARRVNRNVEGRVKDVGVILDLAIHDLDVIRYLVGGDPEFVFATAMPAPGGRHEERAQILLRFPGGVTAVVDTNWLTPRKVRRLALTCSKAYVEADYILQTLEVSTSRAGAPPEDNLFAMPLEHDVRTHQMKAAEPLAAELRDFLRAVETGARPLVPGEDGLAALAIAHAALQSAAKGRPVALSEVLAA